MTADHTLAWAALLSSLAILICGGLTLLAVRVRGVRRVRPRTATPTATPPWPPAAFANAPAPPSVFADAPGLPTASVGAPSWQAAAFADRLPPPAGPLGDTRPRQGFAARTPSGSASATLPDDDRIVTIRFGGSDGGVYVTDHGDIPHLPNPSATSSLAHAADPPPPITVELMPVDPPRPWIIPDVTDPDFGRTRLGPTGLGPTGVGPTGFGDRAEELPDEAS
ncbi:hypothetical protein [Herbiconiux liangxiaofengii]|uniref:hypothetical protein n=1 Tax=Herbiconiux liangxiaofengii TaxID=3342795 RepID=UPI0035BA4F8C